MHLPENSEQFKVIVIEKIKTYCDTGIWPFEYHKFTAWLSNFDCKLEEYLALQLLDSLIVRSKEMAQSSFERLFNQSIKQHLTNQDLLPFLTLPDWKYKLKRGYLNSVVRFYPVKCIDDAGESGGAIYRLISSFIETEKYTLNEKNTYPVIILIDDFIGSGEQFLDFAKEFSLRDKLSKSHFIYCPLVALDTGIETISKVFPELKILPAEIIKSSENILDGEPNKLFKNDPKNTVSDVKTFLEKMHVKYAPRMNDWLGRGEASLTLSFEWGCPNQTFPLLFMHTSKIRANWVQLFNRRA